MAPIMDEGRQAPRDSESAVRSGLVLCPLLSCPFSLFTHCFQISHFFPYASIAGVPSALTNN